VFDFSRLELGADGRVVEAGCLCGPVQRQRIRMVFGEYYDAVARLQAKLAE